MLLRIKNRRFSVIVVLTTMMLLLGYSFWHLPVSITLSHSTAETVHHTSLMSDECSAHHQHDSHLASPKSMSTSSSSCTSMDHCAVCGTLISNYAINLHFSADRELYLPIRPTSQYKEFTPELKPPQFS